MKLTRDFKHYLRNYAGAAVACTLGGIAGAEASEWICDIDSVNSLVSTASVYIAGTATFAYGHLQTYKEHFKTLEGSIFKHLAKDIAKAYLVFAPAEIGYLIVRPPLMYWLQKNNIEPAAASLITDAIIAPFYIASTIPLAKKANIIKGDLIEKPLPLEEKL